MMTGIGTSIELYDRVSAPINNMLSALNGITRAFDSVESSMNGAFDTSAIDDARDKVHQATAQMISLGEEIENNERKQDKFNNEVEESVGLGSQLKTILGGIGLYFGLSEIKQQVSQAIDYASDLQEVQNVVDVAFGESAKEIDKWAVKTLEAYGLNELSAKRFSGTMGAMLKSSGMSGQAVTDMSMRITELAGDMASFYNLDGEEAFNKLRSGISGETEPLKQLGINMSVANLEAYALSQGIEKSYNEMSQAEQVMLRYNYLMQTTQDAQGDFARTSGSFANQTKLLSESWKEFTGELAGSLLPILAAGIRMLNGVVGFMAENWNVIAPILGGVAAAIALVNAPLLVQAGLWLWNSVLVPAYTAVLTFLKIGYGVLTGSTAAASAAQFTYNNALLACPLTWILLIIIAVIAAVYAIVAAINNLTGSTLSATGIIVGTLTSAVSIIWNLFLMLLNLIIQGCLLPLATSWDMFANFFGNIFNDPIATIIRCFESLANSVLGILQTIANAIDAIFGSNLASTVQGWMDSVSGKADELVEKYGNGTYEEKSNMTERLQGMLNGAQEKFSWKTSDAWNTGYSWGEGIGNSVSGMFGGGLGGGLGGDLSGLGGGYDAGQVPSNIADTASNTGKAADSLDITSEDLKYLKDIAETEVINRFTTAEIKVDMTNNNTVNSGMDIDGIVDSLATGVNEAMEKAAEGVHS